MGKEGLPLWRAALLAIAKQALLLLCRECSRRETPLENASTPRQWGASCAERPLKGAPGEASSALPQPPLLAPPRLSWIAVSAFVRLAMLGM